jgi:predicted GNAT superfamily acetyltransferase
VNTPARAGLAEAATPPITIRPLSTLEERNRCVALQAEVWGPEASELVPERMLALAQRLGGILSGAFDEHDELIGFVFGLTGVTGGKVLHWSDMLAVRAGTRNRGIGDALKRHQRDLLLRQGVPLVQWTFEPLESRNAHINLAHLGVVVREYVRDFYPGSASPLHGEIGTDRIIAEWPIASDRVARRLHGASAPPTLADVADTPVVNAVRFDGDLPRPHAPDLERTEPHIRIAVPSRIQDLKQADPALARDWRAATRAAFERYLVRGYIATEFVRGDGVGYYVLRRGGVD